MKRRLLKIISSMLLFFSTVSFATSNSLKKHEITKKEVHNVAILGGGVGALTSGIYLARAGYVPLIIEGSIPGGLITQSHSVENWPGENKISGSDLADKLKDHALRSGCSFLAKEVVDVDFSKKPFKITIKDLFEKNQEEKIYANSCIIAMGSSSNYLNVEGEQKYWGKGVSNCAVCDGALYKNKKVAIVGGGDAAVLEAHYLSNLAKKVSVLVRRNKLRAGDKVKINAMNQKDNIEVFYNTKIVSINGDRENVKSISVFDNVKKKKYDIDVDGVFLAIGSKPNTKILKDKLALNEEGYIVVNNSQETSVKGIYAIGDIVDPNYKQAITAAGDGAKAAISCQKSLDAQTLARPHVKMVSTRGFSLPTTSISIEITNDQQFEQEMKANDMPIIIDFYASWCRPCKRIAPLLESKAKLLQDKVKILKVDVQKFRDIASRYQISAMPTVVVLGKDRKMLFKRMGTRDISSLLSSLEKIKDKNIKEIEAYLQKVD